MTEVGPQEDEGRRWRMGLLHTDVDLERIARARSRLGRRRLTKRRFRDAIHGEGGRADHQRVVPLPLTIAAVALPFLAAWATAMPADGPGELLAAKGSAFDHAKGATAAAESLLDRGVRIPERAEGYVDLWAAPAPWEARVLEGRGYVASAAPRR